MFKPIFGISLLTSFCATLALAQQQPAALPDSIASVPFCHAFRFPITNFTAKDYNGFTQNWAITQDDRGVIYVANGNALLQYDGTSWKSFPTKLGRQLRSLDIDAGNKPWFGAMGEAGFFAPDSSGQLVPNNCITGALSNNIALSIVWNTHVIYDGDDTTKQTAVFNDLQAVYLCNDTLIGAVRPRKKSFQSFAIDGNIWIHYPGKGIALLTPPDTGIFMFTGSEMFSELSVFAVIKYAPNKVFLVTRENGFFAAEYNTAGSRDTVHRVSANMAPVLLNTRSFTVQDENSLIEAQVYGGCLTGTNELAVNTIRNGLFIYDCCGVLRKRFDRHDGLMNESVKFVYPVRVDLLWLALNNGIAVVEHNSPVAVAKEGEFFSGGVEDIVRAGNMIYFATQQGVYRFFAPVSPELVDAPFNARFTADIFHDILPVEGINDQCWDLLNTGREIFVAANSCLFV
ncbi:MAG: hypothetical protein HY738_10365, partial [Bacteroidia bacterium]|nr:hypothetical protein [Bacteroidia bacterium]